MRTTENQPMRLALSSRAKSHACTRERARAGAHGSARASLAMRAWLTLAALLLLTACDGTGVVSPGQVRYGQVGSSNSSSELVGTWRRAVFFIDDFGAARSSETSWQFSADGAVVRVQVTRNLSFGLADVIVSAGRYRMENSRVLIEFVSPAPSQLAFEVRRTGNQLSLAGEPYLRVED